jgi:hypothetical protein
MLVIEGRRRRRHIEVLSRTSVWLRMVGWTLAKSRLKADTDG